MKLIQPSVTNKLKPEESEAEDKEVTLERIIKKRRTKYTIADYQRHVTC